MTEKFNRAQRFSDIDAMFREEDQETASGRRPPEHPGIVGIAGSCGSFFFSLRSDSFSPLKQVLLWSKPTLKSSKGGRSDEKIETHPSPEKLLRQVTGEAVNALPCWVG